MTRRYPENHDGQEGDAALAAELLAPLDARPGPARRLSSAASAAMLDSILERALDPVAGTAGDLPRPVAEGSPPAAELPQLPPARPAPQARRWARTLATAAAATLVFFAGSGASALAWRLLHVELGDPEPAPRAPPPRSDRRHAAAPTPPAAPLEVVVPPAIVEPQAEALVPPAIKKRVQPEPPPAPAPAPIVVVPENLPPEDLLASANERRQRRAWREADVFYGAVVSRFSGSDAAIVAEVASAALHLQHLGDTAGALAAYRRTLGARPSGPLAEEARWGIAEAQRALGDTRAEAEALREFLERHPRSALAPSAQRRLAGLAP